MVVDGECWSVIFVFLFTGSSADLDFWNVIKYLNIWFILQIKKLHVAV